MLSRDQRRLVLLPEQCQEIRGTVLSRDQRRVGLPGGNRNSVFQRSEESSAARRSEEQCLQEIREEQCF
jgi:hypothetical protein